MNRLGSAVVGFIVGAVALTIGIFVLKAGDALSLAAAALVGIAVYGFSRFA